VGTCGGDFDYSQNWGASWTSGNNSVLSVIDNSWQATYEGNAEGTTYLVGFVSDSWGCYANAFTPDITVIDNTPVVTGMDPSDWPADGIAHQVTFTGQYFGNNQPALTFSDSTVGYSLLSYNDSQIVANVTVPSGTPDEDVTVSVTSNGYNGNGFQSGGGAVSPTGPARRS
jgi:IPT/TIG domain